VGCCVTACGKERRGRRGMVGWRDEVRWVEGEEEEMEIGGCV